MKLFMCFGGAAAVADDEAAAAAAASHRDQRGRSLSFRAKFLSGKKGIKKKPSAAASPLAESKKRAGMDADDVYGRAVFGPSMASASASSMRLSSAASMDLGYSSSSSSSRSSTASSSPSVSGVLSPPPAERQANKGSSSTATGAAAVVLCLLMVVFCGRVGATLLTSMVLYLFPRRRPARTAHGEDGVGSLSATPRRRLLQQGRWLGRGSC